MNISPAAIERAITPRTSAILGVHVFGTPCDLAVIDDIAARHGLKVIYDGAHAFGVEVGGRSIAKFGDVQMFSFNATKLFTTGEGGCIVFKSDALMPCMRRLRRWGMLEEADVTIPGWNGMMTEIQAALGLCNLRGLDAERMGRERVIAAYRARLSCVPGVRFMEDLPGTTRPALSYFVIRLQAQEFLHTRDDLLSWLQKHGIAARRYFCALTSGFECYRHLPGAGPGNLPNAVRVADEVLSLPLYAGLGEAGVNRVCDVIEALHHQAC
jgi:dTDP-4-amino-4,6-dideoxygalactose transaminase